MDLKDRGSPAGFPAEAVSGRLSREARQQILERYEQGETKVLCACDVLNEGWDAPQTAVLLMARPTLSRVIYQQQIGCGMRTFPGKKCLVLFDFVDAFNRHNQALSIHRLLRKPNYRPGERMFGADEPGEAVELPLHLWASDYQPVNVFDWQEQVEGMVTARALSKLLRKTDEWVSDLYARGEIAADEVIDLGAGRAIPYFRRERVAELRARFHLPEVTEENLFDDFLAFLDDMSMTRSYKPVWFLSLLACADEKGKAAVADVTSAFRRFYRDRAAAGQIVERPDTAMASPDALDIGDVREVINRGPFRRFSRLDYVGYARDTAFYQIHPIIWRRLADPDVRAQVEALCRASLDRYYQRAALTGGTANGV